MRLNSGRYSALALAIAVMSFPLTGNGSLTAARQRRQNPPCPGVSVACPDMVTKGDRLRFSVEVKGGDQNVTPTFNWTVSAGSISSGQGTTTIEVDTSELMDNGTVTATVDVGGFARDCYIAQSCTAMVEKKVEPRKLDEYGQLNPEDEEARLDNFAIEIQNDPTAQGYVIAYGGRASRAGHVQKMSDRVKNHLVNKRKLDPQRLVFVDGGHREQPAVELWIVPSGAQPPQPAPTIKKGDLKPPQTKTEKRPARSKKS